MKNITFLFCNKFFSLQTIIIYITKQKFIFLIISTYFIWSKLVLKANHIHWVDVLKNICEWIYISKFAKKELYFKYLAAIKSQPRFMNLNFRITRRFLWKSIPILCYKFTGKNPCRSVNSIKIHGNISVELLPE